MGIGGTVVGEEARCSSPERVTVINGWNYGGTGRGNEVAVRTAYRISGTDYQITDKARIRSTS
jgi:hypothetical protein